MMRGIPGAGKSTVTRWLSENFRGTAVHSTDAYHMLGDYYVYQHDKVAEYHNKNFTAFTKSCRAGKSLIVVDNTNIWPHLYGPYVGTAKACGYKVLEIKFSLLREAWCIHNVPEDVVERMRTALKTYRELLGADYRLLINKSESLERVFHRLRNLILTIKRYGV